MEFVKFIISYIWTKSIKLTCIIPLVWGTWMCVYYSFSLIWSVAALLVWQHSRCWTVPVSLHTSQRIVLIAWLLTVWLITWNIQSNQAVIIKPVCVEYECLRETVLKRQLFECFVCDCDYFSWITTPLLDKILWTQSSSGGIDSIHSSQALNPFLVLSIWLMICTTFSI